MLGYAESTRIRRLASADFRVKNIVNTRNFGHSRSPMHALLQARGDAVIAMASDLQYPLELIAEFVRKWEVGFNVGVGVKPFFFASVQLFFIGMMGEYIADIHTQVQKRPLAVEHERINFKEAPSDQP